MVSPWLDQRGQRDQRAAARSFVMVASDNMGDGGAPARSSSKLEAEDGLGELIATADGCRAFASILDDIGDKWVLQLVIRLADGCCRFNDMRRRIPGLSQRVLVLKLKAMQRSGLVDRTVLSTSPPRVIYELTPLGRSLAGPAAALEAWAGEHIGDIAEARLEFEQRNPTAAAHSAHLD